MAASMAARVGLAFGSSIASSLLIVLVITFITLPVSYIVNRYIYHTWTMRVILGYVALVVWPTAMLALTVLRVLGKIDKVNYFGQFPLVMAGEQPSSSGWLLPRLGTFLHGTLLQPLNLYWDKVAYDATIEPLLLPKESKGPAVNEEWNKEARRIAAIPVDEKQTDTEPAKWPKWKEAYCRLVKLIGAGTSSVCSPYITPAANSGASADATSGASAAATPSGTSDT
jgi:hypothetical protein